MRQELLVLASLASASLLGCGSSPPAAAEATPAQQGEPGLAPPLRYGRVATRQDDVRDDYHGTTVADPYRWLEDQDGAEVRAWAAAQNRLAREFLDAAPQRPALRQRLQELWNYTRYEAPLHAGAWWFLAKNDGLQNQPVWHVTADPATDGEVLLDPNQFSADGTVALARFAPADDGTRVAYAVAASGSDWLEWRVLDVALRQTLPDRLRWSKFAGASWTNDGKGFFYLRYQAPREGEEFEAENRKPQVCYHVIGTEQADDRIVYERPDQPDWGFAAEVTEDGRFLIVRAAAGTDRRNRVFYADLQQDDWTVQPLLTDLEGSWNFVGNDGDVFYFATDVGAERGHMVAVLRTDPAPAKRRVLIAETGATLQGVRMVKDRFLCTYLEDAASVLVAHATTGERIGTVALPPLGSIAQVSGRRRDAEAFVTWASFTEPPTIHRCDPATATAEVFRRPQLPFDPARMVTARVFLQGRDGTRVPMFLVHKKGLRLDGSNPTYLYGYGGFHVAMTPVFAVPNLVWIEQGGVYAHACLRGGGEFGKAWHEAGMRDRKQNVFDDFFACAEYLVRNRYTSPALLACGGRSNGGLLAAAALVQRPDLFGAVVPEVPVIDMLRYHEFTIGWAWAPEYGRSDVKEEFEWLVRYSPLHNVRPGTSYPPVLLMTADHDDRVLPGHSYKFAAALQAAQAGPAPILLRVETDAGHGAGKPTGKLIDEAADRWAFLLRVLAAPN
jgi:prolyl oligopeptidase